MNKIFKVDKNYQNPLGRTNYVRPLLAEQFVNNKGFHSYYSGSVLTNPKYITLPSKPALKFVHPKGKRS